MGDIGLEPTVLYKGEQCTHFAARITYFHTTDSETILFGGLLNLPVSIDSIMGVARVGELIGEEVGDIEVQRYHRLRQSHNRRHTNKCANIEIIIFKGIYYHFNNCCCPLSILDFKSTKVSICSDIMCTTLKCKYVKSHSQVL